MSRRPDFIHLSKKELDKLEGLMKDLTRNHKYRERRRGNALLMSHQGRTVLQIARSLERSSRTIYEWLRNYRREGLRSLLPRIYPRRLSPEQLKELLRVSLWETAVHYKEFWDKVWPYRKMAEWVFQKWGIKLSANRIRQIVHQTYHKIEFPYDI